MFPKIFKRLVEPFGLKAICRHHKSMVPPIHVKKIGFIGLGNMGASMAKNLAMSAISSHPLLVYDLVPMNVSKIVGCEFPVVSARSIRAIAEECDIIVTMVPNTQHVVDILRSPDGILANAKPNTLIIDCSTIDPITSAALSKDADAKQMMMLDAPVSGGVTGAAAGTLTFMVGGSNQALEEASPVLSAMGKSIVHCGKPGTGGIAKLCNNLSLAISMIGVCEAMSLGEKLGMNPEKLTEVMKTSTAQCWSLNSYNPVPGIMPTVPSSHNYSGGFGSALMEKDLTLAMDAAKAVKASLPLGSNAHQLYGLLCNQGFGDRDFSVVFKYLQGTSNSKKSKK